MPLKSYTSLSVYYTTLRDQDPRLKECQKNGCKTDITEGGLLRRTVIIRKLVGLNGKEVDLWQLMLFKLKLKKKKKEKKEKLLVHYFIFLLHVKIWVAFLSKSSNYSMFGTITFNFRILLCFKKDIWVHSLYAVNTWGFFGT